jgi:hypothetical protein
MKVLFVLTMISLASVAQAQEKSKFDWKPYAALVAGQTADMVSTQAALNRGCAEGNARVYGAHPSSAKLIATKALSTAGIVGAMHLLHKVGWVKAEKVFGYVGGGVGAGTAAWNFSLNCRSGTSNFIVHIADRHRE